MKAVPKALGMIHSLKTRILILKRVQRRCCRKVMVEAGLLARHREGSWVYYRLAEGTPEADFMRRIVASLDRGDRVVGSDRERFATVRTGNE